MGEWTDAAARATVQRERRRTGTWPPEPPREQVAIVEDPAMRAVLLARRRALLSEVASLDKHLGLKAEEGLPHVS